MSDEPALSPPMAGRGAAGRSRPADVLAYRGRFAPSPTGPLHFGSLVAALGSRLDARAHQGAWLLRIEDVDEPRCRGPWRDVILRQLEAYGFVWDGEPRWQSRCIAHYQAALERLIAAGLAYPCACTRQQLAAMPRGADGAHLYPGTCRAGPPPGRPPRAWRLRVPDEVLRFEDRIQGEQHQALAREVGDFVLRRADGYFAYQLAVVVDDAEQGITHVVRGADLLASTARQMLLQRLLGYPTPQYAHLPLAIDDQGEKLSKQTQAPPLDEARPVPTLHAALSFLGQLPPPDLARASLATLWQWAEAHWLLARVPRQPTAATLPALFGGRGQ